MDGSKDTNDRTQDYASQADESATAPLQAKLGPGIKLKDRYVIERELGQGGFGVVYLARDEELHSKRVVIKVLLEEFIQDTWFKKKFQQEKEALARIDHPGVVGVLDGGKTPDGKQFLVMQFVEGQTLASLIRPEGMELEQVARIMQQMGKALTAAHNEGIIHCDLKPENVIVQKAGEDDELTKIIDFGIAKVRDSQVARGNDPTRVAGTIYYIAPEQIEGKPSASSDIYSMGVLAYIMVTGRRPFTPSRSASHIAVQELLLLQRSGVKFRPKELRPDLPDAAQKAILRALAFDPKDRYPLARDFGNALAQALTTAVEEKVTEIVKGETTQGLEMAHVLFLDIVEYSKMLMGQQADATRHLQESIRSTPQFNRAQLDKKVLSLPTGDGMALVFFGDPLTPVKCADEISRALKNWPQVGVRMGLHTGPIYHVQDINANFNIVGGGINTAQRVMDCGDAGHILASKAIADVLKQVDGYSELVHDLGDCEVKHGELICLYNLYNDEIGNPRLPGKLKKDSPRLNKRAITTAAILAMVVIAAVLVWTFAGEKKESPVKNNNGTTTVSGETPKDTGQPASPELALSLSLEAQKPKGPVVPLFDQIKANGEINFDFKSGHVAAGAPLYSRRRREH
ncbi:MAG: hypothetical protein DMF60_12425 [Acidobacteria bacterium]|nr:MAG: hypothetical protein DMF60_12425 [Acidobacteriota bacterium]